MSNMELKPCPVCGATKGLYILEDYHEFEWYVFCDNCKTSLCNENAQTKEDAIKYWNTRYDKVCYADEVTHRDCKYSVNRGWCEHTCRMIDNGVELCCSKCDERHLYDDEPNFCKGCGAKVVD